MQVRFDRTPSKRQGILQIIEHDAAGPTRTHELAENEAIEIGQASTEYLAFAFIQNEDLERPGSFVLHGNYPNPFNPSTRIAFDLPADANVEVEVFDLLGRSVSLLHFNDLPAGTNRSVDVNAQTWPAGTYLYRVTAEIDGSRTQQTGRMVLLK
jgi:hypothetical protein